MSDGMSQRSPLIRHCRMYACLLTRLLYALAQHAGCTLQSFCPLLHAQCTKLTNNVPVALPCKRYSSC
jgi:hypothetical protein